MRTARGKVLTADMFDTADYKALDLTIPDDIQAQYSLNAYPFNLNLQVTGYLTLDDTAVYAKRNITSQTHSRFYINPAKMAGRYISLDIWSEEHMVTLRYLINADGTTTYESKQAIPLAYTAHVKDEALLSQLWGSNGGELSALAQNGDIVRPVVHYLPDKQYLMYVDMDTDADIVVHGVDKPIRAIAGFGGSAFAINSSTIGVDTYEFELKTEMFTAKEFKALYIDMPNGYEVSDFGWSIGNDTVGYYQMPKGTVLTHKEADATISRLSLYIDPDVLATENTYKLSGSGLTFTVVFDTDGKMVSITQQ